MYKVYFDTTEISGFHSWQLLRYSLKRDREQGGMIAEDTATLKFTSDAYVYLKDLYSSGFCGEVAVKVYEYCGSWQMIYKGIIFVVDCKFNISTCIAEVKLNDDSYYSRIKNNQSVPVRFTYETTKNNEVLAATPRISVDMFNPQSGASVGMCEGITVYEALKTIVAYISDNELVFESTCFNTGGDYAGATLFTGEALFRKDTEESNYWYDIQFGWLMEQLRKIYNVSWDIYRSNGQQIIRIDKSSTQYLNDEWTEFENVPNIIQVSDVDILYSKISVGSSDTLIDGSFYESIALYGFSNEEYTILGQCNIDKTLDLSYDIVTSSNVIEAAFGDDQYNEAWFLIDCPSGVPTQTNWLSINWVDGFYNEAYTNEKIIVRHFGGIPNRIADTLTSDSYKFRVGLTSAWTSSLYNINPFYFDDETAPNHDIGNVWNPVTYEFTAPFGALYDIRVYLNLTSTPSRSVNMFISAWVYDESGYAGGNDYETVLIGHPTNNTPCVFDYTESVWIPQGYKMTIQLEVVSDSIVDFTLETDSFVECTGSNFDEADIEVISPESAKIIMYEFEHPLSKAQVREIAEDKFNKVKLNDGKNFVSGWIQTMETDRLTGKTKFKIINTKSI